MVFDKSRVTGKSGIIFRSLLLTSPQTLLGEHFSSCSLAPLFSMVKIVEGKDVHVSQTSSASALRTRKPDPAVH